MIAALMAQARAQNLRICCAESCTGGMLAALLTQLPGSSDVFDCGFVTYSNGAKMAMLGVLQSDLDSFGAVSEAVALAMAKGALDRSNSHIAVSITGIAGPGGSAFKPEGRVCFALATRMDDRPPLAQAQTMDFGALGRDEVRMAARDHALALLLRALT
jgi:nicotinamide-nucleotide amidase